MTLAAGTLNRQLLIEKRSGEKDSLNQPVNAWVEVGRPWAYLKGDTGMGSIRQYGNDQGLPRDLNMYSMRLRYTRAYDASMRVSLVIEPGVHYDIKLVRHDLSRREWTDLVCQAGGNNA